MNNNLVIKILTTLMLLLIYRIGTLIVIPGLPADTLYPIFLETDFNSYETIRKFTLLGAGISPYISATTLLLIIALFSKKIKNLLMGGSFELQKLEKIILIIATLILIGHALGLNYYMKAVKFPNNLEWSYDENIMSQLLFITSRVCGGIVVIYIARAITRIGIINGALAIILVDSFYNIKPLLANVINNWIKLEYIDRLNLLTALILIFALIILCIIFLMGSRNVKIYDSEKNKESSEALFFPVRINTVGNVPIETATALMILILVQIPTMLGTSLAFSNFHYYIFLIILSIIFVILFAYMSFKPQYILDTLNKFKYTFLTNNNDENHAIEFLKDIYRPMVLISIIATTCLALMPLLMTIILKNENHLLIQISGIHILLICCVIIDVKRRLQSLKKINNTMTSIAHFNTQLEADLFLDRLKNINISGIALNNRVLPLTGTFSYWEISVPSFPYFITHRNLAGGTISVYVNIDDKEPAAELLHKFYISDFIE